jgi:hypothetical protein
MLLATHMPEVGLGAALERFELHVLGEQHCVVDIMDDQHATLVLNALPEFPIEIEVARARQFVAAWRERNNIQGQPYDVRAEQREV